MKRIGKILLIIMVFIVMISCGKKNNMEVNSFDPIKAKEVATKYVNSMESNDVNNLQDISSKKFKEKESYNEFINFKINGYKIVESIEGADYFKLIVDTNTISDNDVRCNLDRLKIKVILEDKDYKVDEVTLQERGEVYEENNKLRIFNADEGKTSLLLRLRDIPKDMYSKEEDLQGQKINIPRGNFTKVILGFNLNMVAFSVEDEGDTYLGMVTVKEAKETIGANGSSGKEANSSGDNSEEGLDELIEKPEIDKIINYDVIKDGTIEKVYFSEDDEELIVQYLKGDNSKFIKVYNNPSGEVVKLELEEIFKRNEYNVEVESVEGNEIIITATALGDNKKGEGSYKIDIKTKKFEKM